MQRRPDWEQRLAAFLEETKVRPFEWGRCDCALFAAGAVEAVTGEDHGAAFRGRYRSPQGSLRALRRQGFGDVFGPFDAALGERVPPLLLRRGDIVAREGSVGVFWQSGRPALLMLSAETERLETFPATEASFGWRVG